jgi:hypothetical protein
MGAVCTQAYQLASQQQQQQQQLNKKGVATEDVRCYEPKLLVDL